MINFIIALFVKKELLTEEEGRKLSKAVFGRPIPDEYDLALAFVERLLIEAKLSSTRKYFDPATIENKGKKVVIANKK
jgi:hypothetical protein